MHTSGEYIWSNYEMRPVKDDPQGRGSCITYQRRYALASVLGLNIDDDDDANEASKPVVQKKEVNGDDKRWLDKGSHEYDAVVKRLQSGKVTIDVVKQHFKLSKAIEAELVACMNKKELIEEKPLFS
jgi:hypothetical protein